MKKTNSAYKYFSHRFSHRLVVIYWTLSARELRKPLPFLRMCKTVSFYFAQYPRARMYTSLCGKEGASLTVVWSVVGNKSGRSDGERRFRARACERGRDNGILCGLEHGAGGLVHASHPFLIWRTRASTSAHSQFKHRPWRQCTGCHPVTFRFVTFRLSVRFGPRDQPSASSQNSFVGYWVLT